MTERLANNATTTLAAPSAYMDSTLVVTSGAMFPSSGNFRILIDSELLLVTGVSGTTWTVTRGIESTSRASHSLGVTITQVLTAGGIAQVISESGGSTSPSVPLHWTHSNDGHTIAISASGQKQVVFVDLSGGSGLFYLPVSPLPSDGQEVQLVDNATSGSWGTYAPQIYCNYQIESPKLAGSFAVQQTAVAQNGGKWLLTWDGVTLRWHSS